eukprot:CAMPEP_0117584954 /NCGR_PEP_ID=MMETSP0784-20121206/67882_1 /TAXON_ID=39447 /ORGANISM="" /LENGTH=64 /DNA_ID=CAMNT_0005385859 /DNA_START=97 /DNA_END=287 /DNA_ORIENTATION=-
MGHADVDLALRIFRRRCFFCAVAGDPWLEDDGLRLILRRPMRFAVCRGAHAAGTHSSPPRGRFV